MSDSLALNEIVLVGKDGDTVRVDRDAATQASLVLHDLFDDVPPFTGEGEPPEPIPIPVADSKVLKVLTDYMVLRKGNPPAEIERPLKDNIFDVLDEKDRNFLKPLDEDMVISLAVTANFLNFPALTDLMSARLAEWIKEKSIEEIRALFGVENDFSTEELTALKKEHGLDRL